MLQKKNFRIVPHHTGESEMDQDDLNSIVEKHGKWLRNEEGGERADLSGARLSCANLSDANLNCADLSDANLSDASLRWCAGNCKEIRSLFISETYPITYTAEYLHIGCERHRIEDWWGFDDDSIASMDGDALEWWREWKDTLRDLIQKHPATPTFC